MNKIRKYLIHLLGGVTREESDNGILYHEQLGRVDAIQHLKWTMEGCYGQPAEE